MNKFLVLLVCATLAGCNSFVKQEEPKPEPIYNVIKRDVYIPNRPKGVVPRRLQFFVVTTAPCGVQVYDVRRDGTYVTGKNMKGQDRFYDPLDGYPRETNGRPRLEEQLSIREFRERGLQANPSLTMCGNLHNKLIEMKQIQGENATLIALTPDGYENLSANTADSQRYISELLSIIEYYEKILAEINADQIVETTQSP